MLEPATAVTKTQWYLRNLCGYVAVALGFASLIAAFTMQFGGTHGFDPAHLPDVRVTIPLLVLAVGAGAGALVRREPLRPLPIAGVGMAGAAMLLGWVVVACAVALVSIVVIAVIAKFH